MLLIVLGFEGGGDVLRIRKGVRISGQGQLVVVSCSDGIRLLRLLYRDDCCVVHS